MPDMEKILEDFEYAVRKSRGEGWDYVDGLTTEDGFKILQLLKEQDPVEPRVSCTEQRCGNCNKVIEMDGWEACPWCGKMIDWERWW